MEQLGAVSLLEDTAARRVQVSRRRSAPRVENKRKMFRIIKLDRFFEMEAKS